MPRSSSPADMPAGFMYPAGWGVVVALLLTGVLLNHSAWNESLLRWFNGLQLFSDGLWASLTLLAFGWAVLILVSITDRGVEAGRAVLLAFIIGGGLGQILKAVFQHPRPGLLITDGSLHFIGNPVLNSPSMPSGHALAALSAATLWVCLLRRAGQPAWLQTLAWGLGALMATSRMAVGAHWPADVLVGAGLGMAAAAACWQLQARYCRQGLAMSRWLPMGVELLAAYMAFTAQEGYPQVQMLQWGLGWLALLSAAWRFSCWWRSCHVAT